MKAKSPTNSELSELTALLDEQGFFDWAVDPEAERRRMSKQGIATYRTADLLNQLFKRAGVDERSYAVEGGNDLAFVFVTQKMYEIIVADPEHEARHGLYVLTDAYPDFGWSANERDS